MKRYLLSVLALVACKRATGPLPVCPSTEVGSGRADEADTRMLPSATWFSLLVPNIQRPQIVAADDARECSGKQIAVVWPDAAAAERDPRSRAEPLPARPLTEADLSFGEGPDGALLVWGRVAFYADGTARGPVALVRWTARGIDIRGIGTLWAPYRRPRLRLEPLDDGQVLVADAEVCPTPDRPGARPRCRREVYLLPLVEQRFVQSDLLEDGEPAGPARIATYEESAVTQKDGWIRRSEVQRSLRFKDTGITIAESVRVRDCDPAAGGSTCDEHELMRYERELAWEDGRFSTSRSAWGKARTP